MLYFLTLFSVHAALHLLQLWMVWQIRCKFPILIKATGQAQEGLFEFQSSRTAELWKQTSCPSGMLANGVHSSLVVVKRQTVPPFPFLSMNVKIGKCAVNPQK